MFCRKCGNKLEEGSAFCNYCGAQIITDKPSEEKEVIAEQEPVQEDVAKEVPSNTAKRSMKLPLIIGLGAAAVALVAGVVIFKPFGLFKTGTNDDGTIAGSDIGETASETAISVGVDVLDYDGHSFGCFFGCSTWEEARDQCEGMGGHLAVITSQEEDEALFAFTRYCGYDNVYIGYSDIEEEGNWQWVTGETSDYSNWNEGEPNGFTPNENYAVYGDNGAWYDGEFTPRIENGLISFICEWDYHVDGATNISSEELQTYIDGLDAVVTETEAAIETQVPSEEIRAAAYASYLGILEANENAIRSCVAFDSYDCALADVTGDGIEDLVITTVGSYPAYGTIDVYSYTVSTNSANNILRLEDIYPTGQMGDVFVAVSDDGQLVVYHDGVGSQAENYYYDIYEYDGNSLNTVNTIKFDTSGYTQSTYTINNEAVTQDVFNSNLTDMIDSIDKLLQHTPENGDFSGWFEPAYDVISSMDSIAMTYDNMHSYLVSNSGSDTLTNDQDAVRSAAYASYLDILEAHHTDIESGEVFNYYNCALADVTHDGIDDLVFTTVGPVLNAADLYVYSYDPITGLANCILYEEGFYCIGGGGTVAMVAVLNTGDLITCSEGYGSAYYDFYTYSVYSFDGVSLTMQDSFYYELYDNSFDTPEMGSELIETYKHNDVDISQSEFSNSEMLLTGSISTLLQCSEGLQYYPSFHEQLHNAIAPLDSIAVTYNDMHALLASYI